MAFTDLERAANFKALRWYLEQRHPPEHMKWHAYDPHEHRTLLSALETVHADEFCCFFG